jgi:hypothetical protein
MLKKLLVQLNEVISNLKSVTVDILKNNEFKKILKGCTDLSDININLELLFKMCVIDNKNYEFMFKEKRILKV